MDDFEEGKDEEPKDVKEGVASIALLPNGSLSGHFIQLPQSICYGLHGTELACEMECSRGEDYRLIKLTIIDYNNKKDHTVVVECRGHDAARFHNINHAHGWEKDVVDMVEEKEGKKKILVSFECETLKSDKAAEEHIKQFMPKLSGLDAVVNIGRMSISGMDSEAETADSKQDLSTA
ncbi:hypothetical protein ERO13_D09G010400v2 [Gossypium hirsutum]|uniref:Uncharacterized protein isoform X1 n=3 Tax=Gossypium TaxID=3633 RepID=A0ABM3ARP8_GOSHI|nr:uncharacterized protein LOC121221095 isoform X1 [Gossypium hirsutum]KAB2011331.1 hypothetical protein ES319_D09G011600v1 [Gossypium barbadense]KAG4128262.1 hypothetical protein ERO13_D09G010400v2 [Gossypium hirsutum]TYG52268.1 hypothetical protein ES288_D09G012900v1 [Gossypium darwinii]